MAISKALRKYFKIKKKLLKRFKNDKITYLELAEQENKWLSKHGEKMDIDELLALVESSKTLLEFQQNFHPPPGLDPKKPN